MCPYDLGGVVSNHGRLIGRYSPWTAPIGFSSSVCRFHPALDGPSRNIYKVSASGTVLGVWLNDGGEEISRWRTFVIVRNRATCRSTRF